MKNLKYALAAAALAPMAAVSATPAAAQNIGDRAERSAERAVGNTIDNLIRSIIPNPRDIRRDRERQRRQLERNIDRVEGYTSSYITRNGGSLRDFMPIRNCAVELTYRFNGISPRNAVTMCAEELQRQGVIAPPRPNRR